MKDHEVRLDRTAVTMLRRKCGFGSKERKRNAEISENCGDWNQSVWLSKKKGLDRLNVRTMLIK